MSPEVLKAIIISVLLFSIFVVMPVLYMLMEHQRKMVRLLRGEQVDESDSAVAILNAANPPALSSREVQALSDRIRTLESEVALLKATQAQQEMELQQRTRS